MLASPFARPLGNWLPDVFQRVVLQLQAFHGKFSYVLQADAQAELDTHPEGGPTPGRRHLGRLPLRHLNQNGYGRYSYMNMLYTVYICYEGVAPTFYSWIWT